MSLTHTVPLGRRSELQLACRVRCLFKSIRVPARTCSGRRSAEPLDRPQRQCSRKLDLLSHTEAAYGGRTASLGASLGTRWARGVVATAWNLAAVDSRMSGRQGGNDFVGRLHRVRIHRSGVIRAALIRQQSSCLPGATRRACLCSATSATPTTRTERRPCRPRRRTAS